MKESKKVNLPLADLRVSDDGCGTYDYIITGDPDNNFVVKDSKLFLTKQPKVGSYSVVITLADMHGRYDSLSVPFSLEVTECGRCIGRTGATTTLPPCDPREIYCQICSDSFACRDIVVYIDDPTYCDPAVQLPTCQSLGFICNPITCRPNTGGAPPLPTVPVAGCDKLLQIAFIDENNSKSDWQEQFELLERAFPDRLLFIMDVNNSQIKWDTNGFYNTQLAKGNKQRIFALRKELNSTQINRNVVDNVYSYLQQIIVNKAQEIVDIFNSSTHCSLFVDNSGSMTYSQVQSTFQKLLIDLTSNNISPVGSYYNRMENFICPFTMVECCPSILNDPIRLQAFDALIGRCSSPTNYYNPATPPQLCSAAPPASTTAAPASAMSPPSSSMPQEIRISNIDEFVSRGGVGTELKKILSKFGIESTPNCKCNARAVRMDHEGIEWCKDNKKLICSWLREEAFNRGLPFLNFVGNKIIDSAIKRAEKKKQ